MNTDKRAMLRGFTVEELKEEIKLRQTLDRAKQHLPSAEAALLKAQLKVKAYKDALEADHDLLKQRITQKCLRCGNLNAELCAGKHGSKFVRK